MVPKKVQILKNYKQTSSYSVSILVTALRFWQHRLIHAQQKSKLRISETVLRGVRLL